MDFIGRRRRVPRFALRGNIPMSAAANHLVPQERDNGSYHYRAHEERRSKCSKYAHRATVPPGMNTRLSAAESRAGATQADGDHRACEAAVASPVSRAALAIDSSHPQEHACVAQDVWLDAIKIQELGDALVVRAQQLGIDLRRGGLAGDLGKAMAAKEPDRKSQHEYPTHTQFSGGV